jgi:hypothetical protein
MIRRTELVLFPNLAFLLTGCLALSHLSATAVAFGESTGRGAPAVVQYYEAAGDAFDQYLKLQDFSVTTCCRRSPHVRPATARTNPAAHRYPWQRRGE